MRAYDPRPIRSTDVVYPCANVKTPPFTTAVLPLLRFDSVAVAKHNPKTISNAPNQQAPYELLIYGVTETL
jgi:hypothetical protein